MAKRLNNLLRSQCAALRARLTPRLPCPVGLRCSPRRALHLDLLATVLHRLNASIRKLWHILRQLSGDDAYERYLAHHSACHPDTAPLSRNEYFLHRQEQKWSGIKRCC